MNKQQEFQEIESIFTKLMEKVKHYEDTYNVRVPFYNLRIQEVNLINKNMVELVMDDLQSVIMFNISKDFQRILVTEADLAEISLDNSITEEPESPERASDIGPLNEDIETI